MEEVEVFHILDGRTRKIAASAWQAMQGTPRAKSYTAVPAKAPLPTPPEVLALQEQAEAEKELEEPKATKKNSRKRQN